VMLEEGKGVPRDEAEAIRLYKAAVAQQGGSSSAKWRLNYIAAFGLLQEGSQAWDAGALADLLSRMGVASGADLGAVGYDGLRRIAELLKPAAAHAAFSFTGHHF
jgi:TPR repeat protein